MTTTLDGEIIRSAREIMVERYVPVLELLPDKYDGARYPDRREDREG